MYRSVYTIYHVYTGFSIILLEDLYKNLMYNFMYECYLTHVGLFYKMLSIFL